jgi:hypothetical protein
MALIDDIREARAKHSKVEYLHKQHIEEVRQEIERETSLADEISMRIQGLTGELDGLAKIMATQFGGAMIERELLSLGETKSLICRLVISAWKKTEQQ